MKKRQLISLFTLTVFLLVFTWGSSVEARLRFQESSLLTAATRGNVEQVQTLLDNGANVDFKNSFGRTSLEVAVTRGHLETVLLLLEWDADVNVRNKFGRLPWNWV